MIDLARQNIVNQEIPAPVGSGREPGDPDRPFPPVGVSLTPFWVLWLLSNLLSVALGMVLLAAIQGGAR